MEKELTMDGAFRLATAILEITYYDYKQALKYLNKHQSEYNKVSPIVLAYRKWLMFKSEVRNLEQKKIINQEEKARIEEFKITPIPQKPTKKQQDTFNKYVHFEKIAKECEVFYLSEQYKRLTLGKGLDGAEVIKRIKADNSNHRSKINEATL